MCPAIDFPIFKLEDLTDQEYEIYKKQGYFDLNLAKGSGSDPIYLHLSRELIIDCKEIGILTGPKIEADCPIRLIWGTEDKSVPPDRVQILVDRLSDNALSKMMLHWRQGSGHGLSDKKDLALLDKLTAELLMGEIQDPLKAMKK